MAKAIRNGGPFGLFALDRGIVRSLISYDVTDDRRRRLFEALKDSGVREQYSVFEWELDEAELARLCERIEREIGTGEDSCCVHPLGESCKAELRTFGKGEPTKSPAMSSYEAR